MSSITSKTNGCPPFENCYKLCKHQLWHKCLMWPLMQKLGGWHRPNLVQLGTKDWMFQNWGLTEIIVAFMIHTWYYLILPQWILTRHTKWPAEDRRTVQEKYVDPIPVTSSSGFIFTKASFLISRNKQQNLRMKDRLQDFSLPKTPHLSCFVISLHNWGEVRTSFIFVFSLPNNINETVISIYRSLLSAP